MVSKIILSSDQVVMPWKNGQGSTAQIEIAPAGSNFPDGDFSWRLSSATVGAAGQFSQFPGCDRWLVILSGQGLSINGKTWGPFTPWNFQGEDSIQAEPLKDTVVDLGLIYRRDRVTAQMKVMQLASNHFDSISLEPGTSVYVYCANGKVNCDTQHALNAGDTYFTKAPNFTINSEAPQSLIILIEIRPS